VDTRGPRGSGTPAAAAGAVEPVVGRVRRGEQRVDPRGAGGHDPAAAQQAGGAGRCGVGDVDGQLVALAREEPRDPAGADALGADDPGGGPELLAHVHHELGQVGPLKQQSRGHR
jgi:hypothetical protein